MLRLLLSLVVNAVALWVATKVVKGISLVEAHPGYAGHLADGASQYTGPTVLALLVVAVIFALVNALVKPLVQLLSLPFTILTLGLFLLVVNGLMLWLTGWVSEQIHAFGAMYLVDGFWAAFWGGIVVGLVNWVLGAFLPDRGDRPR